jgi:hypothetical protein
VAIDELNNDNDNFDHGGLGFIGGAGISANLTNGRPIGNRRVLPVGPAAPRKSWFDTRAYQSAHVAGGTPMGTDRATSTVSQHLRHRDAQNLFVVGASVFPHNAGYNPTCPLAALPLRLGDDVGSYIERPRMLWRSPTAPLCSGFCRADLSCRQGRNLPNARRSAWRLREPRLRRACEWLR